MASWEQVRIRGEAGVRWAFVSIRLSQRRAQCALEIQMLAETGYLFPKSHNKSAKKLGDHQKICLHPGEKGWANQSLTATVCTSCCLRMEVEEDAPRIQLGTPWQNPDGKKVLRELLRAV